MTLIAYQAAVHIVIDLLKEMFVIPITSVTFFADDKANFGIKL